VQRPAQHVLRQADLGDRAEIHHGDAVAQIRSPHGFNHLHFSIGNGEVDSSILSGSTI